VNKSNTTLLAALISIFSATGMQIAVAQDEGAAQPKVLEEVIVTAQKREQKLIEVPIAITAMTASEIESRGISSLLEAQYAVPGLTMAEFGPGQQRAQLRGISSPGGATSLATIGFYLDEMPVNVGSATALDVRLLDIERIEVLRGPQPALYGEGSMGGTIRYVTARPDLEEFSGRVSGRWGSLTDGDNLYRGSGVLNVPIVEDVLGIRIAVAQEETGGFIDQLSTGEKDVNSAKISTVRTTILWEPSDEFSFSLMALHQDQDQDFLNFAMRDRNTTAIFPSRNDDEYDIVNAVASYDFGSATLLATVGYLDRVNEMGADSSAPFVINFLEAAFGIAPGIIQGAGFISRNEVEMTTQEIRLQSNGDERFNYLLGYYRRSADKLTISSFETMPAGVLPFDPFASTVLSKTEAYAVFGEVSYRVTENLEVTLGGRYYDDEQTVGTDKASFDSFNPRINIAYTLSGGDLVYFNASKGFRSGGMNQILPPPLPTPPANFGPEELFSYEIGTKHAFNDNRVNLELAAYYNDWKEVQAPNPAFVPFLILTNTGNISGMGVDLSVSAMLSDHWTVGGTFGYVGMEYDTDTGAHIKGDKPDLTPDKTWSANLEYHSPISAFGGTEFSARVDYQYTAGYTMTLRDFFPLDPVASTGSRAILNFRAGLDFDRFSTYLFADNIMDDDGELAPAAASLPEPVIGRPRTVGIGFNFEF